MTALDVVHCSGAPRDLGLDQGRAFAGRIAEEAAEIRSDGAVLRWAFEQRSDGPAARVRRDTLRYFPHMGERAMGMAAGSGVGDRALAGLLARAFHASADAAASVLLGGEPFLVRTLRPGKSLFLRHSAPDTDFHSVEIALPWRVPSLAGVNERGLAVASVAVEAASGEGHAAPAVLLTQDVLQRFDLVEKALEWLESRPAGGAADFVLADATGAVAGLEVRPSARPRREPTAGTVVVGEGQGRETLEAAIRSATDLASLVAAVPGPAVVLDPRSGRLAYAGADGMGDWHQPTSGVEAETLVGG